MARTSSYPEQDANAPEGMRYCPDGGGYAPYAKFQHAGNGGYMRRCRKHRMGLIREGVACCAEFIPAAPVDGEPVEVVAFGWLPECFNCAEKFNQAVNRECIHFENPRLIAQHDVFRPWVGGRRQCVHLCIKTVERTEDGQLKVRVA